MPNSLCHLHRITALFMISATMGRGSVGHSTRKSPAAVTSLNTSFRAVKIDTGEISISGDQGVSTEQAHNLRRINEASIATPSLP